MIQFSKHLTIIALLSFIFFSCSSDTVSEEDTVNDTEFSTPEVVKDDMNAEITAADTSSTGVYQEEVDETEETSLQDALKSEATTPVEDGLSFCDCVKKQKELETLMLETEDDNVFDKAMEDLQGMKTGECKILFEGNQSTIEGKQKHEKKVRGCL